MPGTPAVAAKASASSGELKRCETEGLRIGPLLDGSHFASTPGYRRSYLLSCADFRRWLRMDDRLPGTVRAVGLAILPLCTAIVPRNLLARRLQYRRVIAAEVRVHGRGEEPELHEIKDEDDAQDAVDDGRLRQPEFLRPPASRAGERIGGAHTVLSSTPVA